MKTLSFAGALALLAVTATSTARAEGGEIFVDVYVAPEVAWLAHPTVHDALASPFEATGSFAFLPRAGGGIRYGMTNELTLGLGADVAVATNLRAAGVVLGGTTGDVLTGTYAELCAPLVLTWRFDSGYDASGSATVAAGPMVSVWHGNALGDPKRPDADGLPSRLPLDVADAWRLGGVVRGSVALEARFFDVFLIALEPFAALSFSGTLSVHAGLALRPSVAFGLL